MLRQFVGHHHDLGFAAAFFYGIDKSAVTRPDIV
jgi:hypothetical protein